MKTPMLARVETTLKKRPRMMQSGLVAMALAAMIAPGLSRASAAPAQPVVYDALGDSYAAGYGGGGQSSEGRPGCNVSPSAYGLQIDGRMKITLDNFMACATPAVTTSSLVSTGQLDALGDATDLVTISVGGNDIHWSTTIGACLAYGDPVCLGTVTVTRAFITSSLPSLLDSVYSQVSEHAPYAHVVVTGYPRLFSPEYGPLHYGPYELSTTEQQALNDGADLLNQTIAQTATAHGFQFVDVTKRFLDHGANAPDPWILGPSAPAAFHANAHGYQAYAAAVTAAIKPPSLP